MKKTTKAYFGGVSVVLGTSTLFSLFSHIGDKPESCDVFTFADALTVLALLLFWSVISIYLFIYFSDREL